MGITRRLGEWVADVPPRATDVARERAAAAVEDTVACMVAGAGDRGAQAVRTAAGALGDGPATVIGNGGRGASAPFAALANGASAHALDYDDNFLPGLTHASAVLVPALLALAEARDLGGARLLDAYVVGLDVHAVLGRGIGRGHYDLGWHSTSTVGCIGTAAACARLLGLDAAGVTRALSLGVSMASGAKVQFGTPAKPFHAGLAAQHAVLAATLADAGLDAHPEAIEGFRGFTSLYGAAPDVDWDAQLAALHGPPVIETDGLAPKRHPCCGSAHRILDALLALRAEHGFETGDVVRVDAEVGYGNARNLCYSSPRNEMEARFSLNYCVAVALRSGRLTLADFTAGAVQDAEVRALMPRVFMHATPAGAEDAAPGGRLPHRVRVTLADGRVLEAESLWPRGTVHAPFSDAERGEKFDDCVRGFLSAEDVLALRDALARLPALDSVRVLTRTLRFEAGGDSGERFARREAAAAAQ